LIDLKIFCQDMVNFFFSSSRSW